MPLHPRSSPPRFLLRLGVASLVLVLSLPLMAGEGRKPRLRVLPEYPELALRMRVGGMVRLDATVTASGAVQKVKAQSGHPLLVPSAEAAVMQWRFAPAPSESEEVVFVNFTLPN